MLSWDGTKFADQFAEAERGGGGGSFGGGNGGEWWRGGNGNGTNSPPPRTAREGRDGGHKSGRGRGSVSRFVADRAALTVRRCVHRSLLRSPTVRSLRKKIFTGQLSRHPRKTFFRSFFWENQLLHKIPVLSDTATHYGHRQHQTRSHRSRLLPSHRSSYSLASGHRPRRQDSS